MSVYWVSNLDSRKNRLQNDRFELALKRQTARTTISLPVFKAILLFSELSLHLLELHGVLFNGFSLLIDLLLQRTRDFHHLLIMGIDFLPSFVRVLLQVFQTEGPLI